MRPDFEKILSEIEFRFVRSSGKGGQNVNKVSTKAELYFDVNNSAFLTKEQKNLLLSKLASRINDAGILKVSASESRSQADNKFNAQKKFLLLLQKTFAKKKKRIATQIPESLKEKRLKKKKEISEIKNLRKKVY